jgi:hypothetical protein
MNMPSLAERACTLGILFTTALLPACARTQTPIETADPAEPPPEPVGPRIDLHVSVIGEVDPRAHDACEAGVTGTLRRHGFVVDRGGVRVDVEVALLRDYTPGAPSFAPAPAVTGPHGVPMATGPYSGDPEGDADLTARVYLSGAAFRVLRAGATASVGACAVAAERFVPLLTQALGP